MRFSRNWIAQYTDLPDDLQELSGCLSMLGLVVDDMRPTGDDLSLDLDLPSNRPDVMNHVEIAREISVARGIPLRRPPSEFTASGPATAEIASVTIADPDSCRRFLALALIDVAIAESPAWLRDRLESIGLRPINNVVDITNFIMWELGRPLHAYDLDKLGGHCLQVRYASAGERLVTLDEVERQLTADDLVIADADGPVGLAGLMGGTGTGVTESTTRIVLECACFDAVTIRRMAKRHGMHTDASHRFERGMSEEGITAAIDRAARLVLETAGGKAAGSGLDVLGHVPPPVTLQLGAEHLRGYLGVDIEPHVVIDILEKLGFGATSTPDGYSVAIPPRRGDVSLGVDLIEEIARFHGYDRLPGTLPLLRRADGRGLSPELRDEASIRAICAAQGYWESMTFVFTSEAEQSVFVAPEHGVVELANPLSEATGVLRGSLLPGLLASLARNLNRGATRVRLFEIGRTFTPAPDSGPPIERRRVGLVACGTSAPRHFQSPGRDNRIADLKGALETLRARMQWPEWTWSSATVPGLQAGLCARLEDAGRPRGIAGKLDAAAGEPFGIDVPVWVAELLIDDLVGRRRPEFRVATLPRFPASARDVSLLVPAAVHFAQLQSAAESIPAAPLVGFELLDVYRGADVVAGSSALTLRLTFRSDERTLTAEEIEAAHESVVGHLESEFGARRR